MANTTSHPAAESLARRMPLPLMACPAVLELYGYTHPVLNRTKAVRELCQEGYLVGTPAHDAAMAVLEARAEFVASR